MARDSTLQGANMNAASLRHGNGHARIASAAFKDMLNNHRPKKRHAAEVGFYLAEQA